MLQILGSVSLTPHPRYLRRNAVAHAAGEPITAVPLGDLLMKRPQPPPAIEHPGARMSTDQWVRCRRLFELVDEVCGFGCSPVRPGRIL